MRSVGIVLALALALLVAIQSSVASSQASEAPGQMVLEDLALGNSENVAQAMEAATWRHPHLGEFNVQFTEPRHQVVTSSSYYDENGVLVSQPVEEYIISVPDRGYTGRVTIGSDFVGGYLLTEHGDIEVTGSHHGNWRVTLGMSSKGKHHTEPIESGPSPPGLKMDESGSAPPAYVSPCALLSVVAVKNGCLDAEELVDIPVGDDGEAAPEDILMASMAAAQTQATTIKVRVYHESKSNRASSDCNYANDRIFEEETQTVLECDLVSVGTTRHDAGTAYGYDDWINFLDEYYDNHLSLNYKSNTIAYNGGRFVAFLPEENVWHTSGYGGTRDCGDPDWSATSEINPCGHLSIYDNVNTYYVHSAAYREGQTFAHEMIHDLNVASTGYTGHDDTTASKNYNGDEGCDGRGDDFLSWNVFFATADGGSRCSHRHYWVAPAPSNVEADIPANAARHTTHY